MTIAARSVSAVTQPLHRFSSAYTPSTLSEPRRRHPRDTASLAATQPIPAIGRAGSREWARAGDACFGGGEVR